MINEGNNKAVLLLEDFLTRYKEDEAQLKETQRRMRGNFAEMKAQGFNPKILRAVAKMSMESQSDREKRLEEESLLDAYKGAINLD